MLLSEATGGITIFLIQAGGFLYSYKFEEEMYKKSQFYLYSSYAPLSVFNDPSLRRLLIKAFTLHAEKKMGTRLFSIKKESDWLLLEAVHYIS